MATALQQARKILTVAVTNREQLLTDKWKASQTTEKREECWIALNELRNLAGAIEDELKRNSDGND